MLLESDNSCFFFPLPPCLSPACREIHPSVREQLSHKCVHHASLTVGLISSFKTCRVTGTSTGNDTETRAHSQIQCATRASSRPCTRRYLNFSSPQFTHNKAILQDEDGNSITNWLPELYVSRCTFVVYSKSLLCLLQASKNISQHIKQEQNLTTQACCPQASTLAPSHSDSSSVSQCSLLCPGPSSHPPTLPRLTRTIQSHFTTFFPSTIGCRAVALRNILVRVSGTHLCCSKECLIHIVIK
jgi:hypothetical protein